MGAICEVRSVWMAAIGLDAAGGAEQVADLGLEGAHRDAVRVFAEDRADRPRLGDVADLGRRRVRGDVVDLPGVDARVVEGDGGSPVRRRRHPRAARTRKRASAVTP